MRFFYCNGVGSSTGEIKYTTIIHSNTISNNAKPAEQEYMMNIDDGSPRGPESNEKLDDSQYREAYGPAHKQIDSQIDKFKKGGKIKADVRFPGENKPAEYEIWQENGELKIKISGNGRDGRARELLKYVAMKYFGENMNSAEAKNFLKYYDAWISTSTIESDTATGTEVKVKARVSQDTVKKTCAEHNISDSKREALELLVARSKKNIPIKAEELREITKGMDTETSQAVYDLFFFDKASVNQDNGQEDILCLQLKFITNDPVKPTGETEKVKPNDTKQLYPKTYKSRYGNAFQGLVRSFKPSSGNSFSTDAFETGTSSIYFNTIHGDDAKDFLNNKQPGSLQGDKMYGKPFQNGYSYFISSCDRATAKFCETMGIKDAKYQITMDSNGVMNVDITDKATNKTYTVQFSLAMDYSNSMTISTSVKDFNTDTLAEFFKPLPQPTP